MLFVIANHIRTRYTCISDLRIRKIYKLTFPSIMQKNCFTLFVAKNENVPELQRPFTVTR
jgi:hypothetical protein